MKTLLASLLLAASISLAPAQSLFEVFFAPVSTGTGSGGGSLTLNGTTLTFNNVTYSGLSGTYSASHIHGPLPSTGVLVNLSGIHTPSTTSSGTFNGSVNLTAQSVIDLTEGELYVNIHSSTFGGGEISGIITAVPEPGTAALVGLGLGALLLRRRRQA